MRANHIKIIALIFLAMLISSQTAMAGQSAGIYLSGDFGSLGFWGYDGNQWNCLNVNNPSSVVLSAINSNGKNVVTAAFPGYGLYYWDLKKKAWTNIHLDVPQNMVAWRDRLIADYGSLGLWEYSASQGWKCLNVNKPSMMTTAMVDGSGQEVLVAYFPAPGLGSNPGVGLYTYNGTTWTWINENQPDVLTTFNNKLVGDFGTLGVWTYDTTNKWVCMNINKPDKMLSGTGSMAFWYPSNGTNTGVGLYLWNGTTWTWINENTPDSFVWWNNTLVGDFGTTLGVWKYDSGKWSQLNVNNPTVMTATDIDGSGTYVLVASYPSGVWYNTGGTSWNNLNLNQADTLLGIQPK